MTLAPVLIGGTWRPANFEHTFHGWNPCTGEPLSDLYPSSSWVDCEEALDAGIKAAALLRTVSEQTTATFLDRCAERIEAVGAHLVWVSSLETGLPENILWLELGRTAKQLRLAATACRTGSWIQEVGDPGNTLRARRVSLRKPIVIFGCCNFPEAFNAVSGGDFAAAIATGNAVLAVTHYLHPRTSHILAEMAAHAAADVKLPPGTVQMLHHMGPEDGLRLVSDRRVGAVAFTGNRKAGLALKARADTSGIPFYGEFGSINPGVILPGSLDERMDNIVNAYVQSALMRVGQMCTNPGFTILFESDSTTRFIEAVRARFAEPPTGPLFSAGILGALGYSIATLADAGQGGAIVTGGHRIEGPGFFHQNTLFRITGGQFFAHPDVFQQEAFGNATLLVIVRDMIDAGKVLESLGENLAGFLYRSDQGADREAAEYLWPIIGGCVGRRILNQMPTGVALSSAMQHGAGHPAGSHAGSTSVGAPESFLRFTRRVTDQNCGDEKLNALAL